MKHAPLAALLLALACTSCATAEEPAKTPTAQPAAKPKSGMAALSAEEQKQLRAAREQAAKDPAIAAARKAAADAYDAAKAAKDAKKPKAEVDALYAKARELRAGAYKMTDDAVIAANPALKPLVEKSAPKPRSSGKSPEAKPATEAKPAA